MPITIARLTHALAAAALFGALSGCAGVGSYGPGATAPGGATEQARLRITDQCVYEASKTANALKDRITPRCQCYARGALRQMSPGDIASVAAGGSVPFTVHSQEIMNACTAHGNAFSEAPRKTGAKKKKKPAGDAPAADAPASGAPPAADAPPPANPPAPAPAPPPPSNTPAPPAGGGEPPK
jgi:hypothetical protein